MTDMQPTADHRPIVDTFTRPLIDNVTSTSVLAANYNRSRVRIKNIDAANFVWLQTSGADADATGYKLAANEEVTLYGVLAITGLADTAPVRLNVIEEAH